MFGAGLWRGRLRLALLCRGGLTGRTWGQESREERDGRGEVVVADADQEVDGIEVLFTTEAATEVGGGVDGRVELLADGTEEAEVAVALLVGPLQHAEDVLQGNLDRSRHAAGVVVNPDILT